MGDPPDSSLSREHIGSSLDGLEKVWVYSFWPEPGLGFGCPNPLYHLYDLFIYLLIKHNT